MKVARSVGVVLVVFVLSACVGALLARTDRGPAAGQACATSELARRVAVAGDVLECVETPIGGRPVWERVGRNN